MKLEWRVVSSLPIMDLSVRDHVMMLVLTGWVKSKMFLIKCHCAVDKEFQTVIYSTSQFV